MLMRTWLLWCIAISLLLVSLLCALQHSLDFFAHALQVLVKESSNTIKAPFGRVSDYPIHELILNRWSSFAMSGEKIPEQQLMQLFEAARWAPSSYNEQPWRFVYAYRDTSEFEKIFNMLVPFNQSWAKNAAVLIMVASKNTFTEGNKPSISHSFDTGAAVENLALQAFSMGLVCHAIGGFDYERAKKKLNVSDDYTVEAVVAIGCPGRLEDLPLALQDKEDSSKATRKKIQEFAFKGSMKNGL